MKWLLIVFLFQFCIMYSEQKQKKPVKFNQTDQSAKFDNPNFVRDRSKFELNKPEMPSTWTSRFKRPYHPAWMDYCDPYHCNDYHKRACGLNRKTMRFKWFQSFCHVILNNKCSTYRGTLQYDVIDVKYCYIYVMFLRKGCTSTCDPDGRDSDPVCAVSQVDNSLTVFPDRCALDEANCKKESFDEYEEADFGLCAYHIDEKK